MLRSFLFGLCSLVAVFVLFVIDPQAFAAVDTYDE